MSADRLPDSREPAVVALCLDWLHDTLPAPHAARTYRPSGFIRPSGARSARSWRSCEQCGGGGATKRGPCPNCGGAGGWHFDPMDDKRAPLTTSADARPEPDRPVVRIVRLTQTTTSERADADLDRPLPTTLALLVTGLDLLRRENRYQRAVLQRVHVIRVDSLAHLREPERALYEEALAHLAQLLPPGFRAPRPIRERAAVRPVEAPLTRREPSGDRPGRGVG